MNINISQLNNHFLSKTLKRNNNFNNDNNNDIFGEDDTNKKQYVSKICSYNFFSINEAKICEKMKNIPYYSNYYHLLHDYDFINIGELNEKFIEKLEFNNNQKYLLFKYKKEETVDFRDFLLNCKTPKQLILSVLNSFSYLFDSLIQLNDNNICFFNLCVENIVFKEERPILHNFKKSIHISKLNEYYITNIIENVGNFINKPLEVHVLFYLIHNNLETISYSFIEDITDYYIKNLNILCFFSQEYNKEFKNECIKTLKKYINKSKTDILKEILHYHDTWDCYSLSILYLHIFCNILKGFNINEKFFNDLIQILCKNISPDPLKRENLENTYESYNKLYFLNDNWSFINKIPIDKMDKIFDFLLE